MGATGALALLQLSSSYAQSSAIESEGNYEKSIADINARFSNINAEDAIKRGDKEATELKKQAKRLIGTQRTSLAAQGIDIESGSALDLQEDTAGQAEMDAMTIRNNAWKEAWGYRVQSQNYSMQGEFAKLSSKNKSRNTLLTGGIQAVTSAKGGFSGFGGGSSTNKSSSSGSK